MSRCNILYEDAELLVFCKPVGLACEGTGQGSVLTLLQEQHACTLYPVHRLDQAVGGVMVYAKTKQAAAALCAEMQNGGFSKTYLCVAEGILEPAQGCMEDLLYKDTRKNKTYVVSRLRRSVRLAKLEYCCLQTARLQEKSFSLCRVKLLTGRSHQIRAQFAARKHPLFADGKYGSREKGDIGLFAQQLSFLHPKDGRALRFAAPVPQAVPWTLF